MKNIEFFDLQYFKENGIPRVDYHSHTFYTDGTGTPLTYAKVAARKNLTSFAITEHIWRTSQWLDNLLRDINETRKMVKVEILSGVEAKQINIYGEIDVRDSDMKKVDLVLGSVHAYPTSEDYKFIDPKNISPKEALEIETEALLALATNRYIDVIAHPYVLYKKHFNRDEIPEEYAKKVILAAIENNVAIEVNSKYKVPNKKFLQMTLQLGGKISFGSDAHKPDEIGNVLISLVKEVVEEIQ